MQKIYILDTNVLLHDPGSLRSFQDNTVVVPIFVIEEVDHFKKEASELGRNAPPPPPAPGPESHERVRLSRRQSLRSALAPS